MTFEPEFLDVEDVMELHQQQIEEHGGSSGVRDQNRLDSAVAQPRMTFGGQYLHEDLFLMAAAYLYHIVKNHPFVDGNKRAGAMAALVFLDLNGHPIERPTMAIYDLAYSIAAEAMEKSAAAEMLRALARE